MDHDGFAVSWCRVDRPRDHLEPDSRWGILYAVRGVDEPLDAKGHGSIVDKDSTELGMTAYPGFNQWWVPLVEFTAGGAVLIGLLAQLATLGLLVIILVAITTCGAAANQTLQADR